MFLALFGTHRDSQRVRPTLVPVARLHRDYRICFRRRYSDIRHPRELFDAETCPSDSADPTICNVQPGQKNSGYYACHFSLLDHRSPPSSETSNPAQPSWSWNRWVVTLGSQANVMTTLQAILARLIISFSRLRIWYRPFRTGLRVAEWHSIARTKHSTRVPCT